jgi:hypothetical protein
LESLPDWDSSQGSGSETAGEEQVVWGCVSSQLLEVWGSYSCLGYDSEHASLGCPLAMMSSEKVWDLKLDSSFDFDSDSDSCSCLSSSSEQHSGFDFDFGFGCDSCFSLLQGFGFGFCIHVQKRLSYRLNLDNMKQPKTPQSNS